MDFTGPLRRLCFPVTVRQLRSQERCPLAQSRQMAVAYFLAVAGPIPGTVSKASGDAGRSVAIARKALSVRMRNAGRPRFLASASRQARKLSSIEESFLDSRTTWI